MADTANPQSPTQPEGYKHRRRVVIQGLSPIRKPGSGIDADPDGVVSSSAGGMGGAAVGSSAGSSTGSSTAFWMAGGVLPFRIGHGYDIHRLEQGRSGGKLILAGVTVSEEISAIAHSDGDVIFHAVVDAILGALGIGDIGELFADSDARWKDASSRIFVDDVYDRAMKMGYRLANCDVTLLLEKPKVLPYKPEMLANLRRLFGTQAQVSIKACTNEQCDAVGRGEAVAAHAVVLLATRAD